MKTLLVSIALTFSGITLASNGSGTGGAPTAPCFINGEYEGTMVVTECYRKGGKAPGEKGWRERQ
ncbi:hypothetical protein [Vibrio sp. WXL103]|uniref:hypothetical protein n=1 Tax=unclassified Vibrio TaxID=2614977 RepID=UPI003EC7A5F6